MSDNLAMSFWWHVPEGWEDQIVDLHNALLGIDKSYQLKTALFMPASRRPVVDPQVLLIKTTLNDSGRWNLHAENFINKTAKHLAETCMVCGKTDCITYEFLSDEFPLCEPHMEDSWSRIQYVQENTVSTRVGIEQFVTPYQLGFPFRKTKMNRFATQKIS